MFLKSRYYRSITYQIFNHVIKCFERENRGFLYLKPE